MNRIYSKVWNKSLNKLVVASELAKSCGKSSSRGTGRLQTVTARGVAWVALMAISTLGVAGKIDAQTLSVNCTAAPYNAYDSTASCMGYGAAASGTGATALGSISNASVLGATAVGYAAQGTGQNAVAVSSLCQQYQFYLCGRAQRYRYRSDLRGRHWYWYRRDGFRWECHWHRYPGDSFRHLCHRLGRIDHGHRELHRGTGLSS